MKRSWGDGIAVRGYSEYRAHSSGFSKHVSRCRQILKIATSDYLSIHSLALAISNLLLRTNQVEYPLKFFIILPIFITSFF